MSTVSTRNIHSHYTEFAQIYQYKIDTYDPPVPTDELPDVLLGTALKDKSLTPIRNSIQSLYGNKIKHSKPVLCEGGDWPALIEKPEGPTHKSH